MMDRIPELEQKIQAIEQELRMVKQVVAEIKRLPQQVLSNEICVVCYFTYSLLLPKTEGQKGMIAGNFVIRNLGSSPLEHPYICLRVSPKEHMALSAKLGGGIQYDRRLNPLVMEAWQYMNEEAENIAEEKGEFWLKPIHVSRIEPGQTLSFSNFQFQVGMREVATTYKMDGFFFCQQLPNGVRALNHIVVHT
ncbi:hypothetical protein VC88_07570 [Geobacillus sp. A8]|nr:hypothetical protein [Geobacillus sp. T6]ASS99495.1 hypothetical protein GT3921_10930 [Geobacillus thermocatenulatus]KLR73054.1 hypothetical protein ABH20_13125 [Geobacillus sp. T6]RAN23151.1 hypothetical protein VC88_07570 [Geobacillus sp. A8]